MKYRLLSMLAISGLIFGGAAAAQERVPDLPQTSLQVVGGFSTLTTYQDFELPFWTKTIPELSEGRVTATIKGYNEMGLKGPEVLRLISQGIIPIGTATLAYFASDNPINEAIDLAGINPTAKIAREVTDAFAPIYRKYYLQRNIKVLGLSTYPAQVLFCNADIKSLADSQGQEGPRQQPHRRGIHPGPGRPERHDVLRRGRARHAEQGDRLRGERIDVRVFRQMV